LIHQWYGLVKKIFLPTVILAADHLLNNPTPHPSTTKADLTLDFTQPDVPACVWKLVFQ
jgi:hypothetical protein